jgi:endoglucanase Acf2
MIPNLAAHTMKSILLAFILTVIAIPITSAAPAVVRVGAGGYLDGLPEGAKGPSATIYRSAELKGPMPTSDWWSSLAWVPFSEPMYPHPLAVRAVEGGLRVAYPGPGITANNAAIFGFMGGGTEDFVLGHSEVEKFTEARVAGFSDWFVTAQFGDGVKGMHVTFGHGSPFVFATYGGGEPVLNFGKKAPEVFAGTENDAVLGVRVGKCSYGLFAPTGSTWTGLGTTRPAAQTRGKSYFALAVLPDEKVETLALFRKHAYAHVTATRVAWNYDQTAAKVRTTFSFSTQALEGDERGTLFALYPHQWRHTAAPLTGHAYASVRGPMKLAAGTEFVTEMTLPGTLPSLPLTAECDRAKLREFIDEDLRERPRLVGDTYWLGKATGKWATLLPLAGQVGHESAVRECTDRLRGALENFFTATNSAGQPKGSGAGVFAYDRTWGALIGYPASFGSDTDLNDHHFHYGYFIRAAGELARRDSAWASDARWGGMIRLLIRDIASPDRRDALFPFLRCFDPYAGHSWASGHGKFGDGNNNESSSEAANAWFGVMLFGEAVGDRALRDLGAWLYTTEIAAIEDYWFDVRGDLFPRDYPASVVTMVWGGKGANGTWFSGNPEAVHGINWLPITSGSLYLGRWPDYTRKNYEALVRENLADDAKKAARKNEPAPTDGTRWDQWADLIWMYRALSDPADALQRFNARPTTFKPEAGNSLANTYAWLSALAALGQVDRTVTADAPFAATFTNAGRRTHVAWNLNRQLRTVVFSDGTRLECPPRGSVVK